LRQIQNAETIVHLHWLKQQFPHMTQDELIAKTASVTYAVGSATQAGYKPVGAFVVDGGGRAPIDTILRFQERGNAARAKESDDLLKKYGFSRSTVMLMDFDITFSVVPE
jgi:hypothetical protein